MNLSPGEGPRLPQVAQWELKLNSCKLLRLKTPGRSLLAVTAGWRPFSLEQQASGVYLVSVPPLWSFQVHPCPSPYLVSYLWPCSHSLDLSPCPISWVDPGSLYGFNLDLFLGRLIWSCTPPLPLLLLRKSRKSFALLLRSHQHYCAHKGCSVHADAVWAPNWFWLSSPADKTGSYF